jgi:hypothetical protein
MGHKKRKVKVHATEESTKKFKLQCLSNEVNIEKTKKYFFKPPTRKNIFSHLNKISGKSNNSERKIKDTSSEEYFSPERNENELGESEGNKALKALEGDWESSDEASGEKIDERNRGGREEENREYSEAGSREDSETGSKEDREAENIEYSDAESREDGDSGNREDSEAGNGVDSEDESPRGPVVITPQNEVRKVVFFCYVRVLILKRLLPYC